MKFRDILESLARGGGGIGDRAIGGLLDLSNTVMRAQAERDALDVRSLHALTVYAQTFLTPGSESHRRVGEHCAKLAARIITRPAPSQSFQEAVAEGAVKR